MHVRSRPSDHALKEGSEAPPQAFPKTSTNGEEHSKGRCRLATESGQRYSQNDPYVALKYEVQEDVQCYENRCVAPDATELQLEILRENRDSKAKGHCGQYKTFERIRKRSKYGTTYGVTTYGSDTRLANFYTLRGAT